MISISFKGLRGEDDSRFQGLKPDIKAVGKAESHQTEKNRCDRDKVLGGPPGLLGGLQELIIIS
jgi:hypothetical protein